MRCGAYLTSAPQPLHPMIFQARKRACPHTVSHVTCVQIFFSMPHHRDRHYRDHTLRPDKTRVRPPAAVAQRPPRVLTACVLLLRASTLGCWHRMRAAAQHSQRTFVRIYRRYTLG